jgi:hypothetical protein
MDDTGRGYQLVSEVTLEVKSCRRCRDGHIDRPDSNSRNEVLKGCVVHAQGNPVKLVEFRYLPNYDATNREM